MAAGHHNEHSRPGIANASAVVRAYAKLAKVRLTLLVVATTAVGFMMAGGPQGDPATLVWTLLGTGLAAAGSMALNQVLEADRDARMERTRNRPLPAGDIGRPAAGIAGAVAAAVGLAVLIVAGERCDRVAGPRGGAPLHSRLHAAQAAHAAVHARRRGVRRDPRR